MAAKSPMPAGVLFRETVPGGCYWSMVIRRGHALRLIDITGQANVAMLLFNAANPLERYSMSDTLKAQHTVKLAGGNMLYSDMGRTLMSIVTDTLGWHDTIGGISAPEELRAQYGESSYQRDGNAFHRSGRELFLIELAKWGLGRQDLVPNINFFSRVGLNEDGSLRFVDGHSVADACVVLRAEMDTLVILNTAPHPMNPACRYAPGAVELMIHRADPVHADDRCISACPENSRAYANTMRYNSQFSCPEAGT